MAYGLSVCVTSIFDLSASHCTLVILLAWVLYPVELNNDKGICTALCGLVWKQIWVFQLRCSLLLAAVPVIHFFRGNTAIPLITLTEENQVK